MDRDEFQPGSPGRLVEVEFSERLAGESRSRRGAAFVPGELPPVGVSPGALIVPLFRTLDTARATLVRLDEHIGQLPDPQILLRALIRREAQTSSRIENTVASLREMVLSESGERPARQEVEEVRRNERMIREGVAASLPLSAALVCTLHQRLIDDDRLGPGAFRGDQVYIGDRSGGFERASFVPPPPSEIPMLMRNWVSFSREDSDDWPPLLRLAISHYQFEAIHPFADGNGRLGRALVNIGAVRLGVVKHPVCNLSEWVQSNRAEYYRLLKRVSTHGAWLPWCAFFVRAVAEQAEADLARAQRVTALREHYQRQLVTKRSSSLGAKLVDQLFMTPAITIPSAAQILGVSYTAAQRHIDRLIIAGVLKPVDQRRYDKVYLAEGILQAIRGDGSD